MPAFTLDARTLEVFGSAVNLADLDNPAEVAVVDAKSVQPLRMSSRDMEFWEVEEDIIEISAVDVKLPNTFFPLQTRLSARDLEVFEADDLMARDPEDEQEIAPALKRRASGRDAECFEPYDVEEIPAHEAKLPPVVEAVRARTISARDMEMCDEAHEWVAKPKGASPVLARRSSGRDLEY